MTLPELPLATAVASAAAIDHRGASRRGDYERIMAHARGHTNDDALAKIYLTWVSGEGALPVALGLSQRGYVDLMRFHFPGYAFVPGSHVTASLDPCRAPELADLVDLMKQHRVGASRSELWVASIIGAACMGRDHLWEDLGVWCRDDLSALLDRNFRPLAEKNVHNMRWKRFLYKQLCDTDSVYACRVPSCEYCADYPRCFLTDEDDD